MIPSIDETADWFQRERGISRDTLRAFRVEPAGDRVRFPYPNGVKERTNPAGTEPRRFHVPPGWQPELYRPAGDQPQTGTAFLVEGETDTMRLWQELQGQAAVFGLSGVHNWRPELATDLAAYEHVWVILDNDQDYNVRALVDTAWRRIRGDVKKARRIELPSTVKDVCEFFNLFDLDYLRLLTQRLSVSRFNPVDFTLPPPPVRWLLEDWVALGDMTLLAGLGGLGKSWVSMALTMAVLTGGQCMGLDTHAQGRVLYVDEENPINVVHDRLKRLGFDPSKHSGNMRYLWNQGIRLDKSDKLLDEALDFQPTLIVLDSLTRFHSGDENSSGFVSALFNEGIKPLAREVGAAVVVIHHHGKSGEGSRGSSDIHNASDAVIDLFGAGIDNPGQFTMHLTKSRRRLGGSDWPVSVTDRPDGSVELIPHPSMHPRF